MILCIESDVSMQKLCVVSSVHNVRAQTHSDTCNEGGLVGVTAQSCDCSGNIYDQISLFGVQALPVQIPRANTRPLCAPGPIINSVPKTCMRTHTHTLKNKGQVKTFLGLGLFCVYTLLWNTNIPAICTGNNWTCTTPGHACYVKTSLLRGRMLKTMETWNLQTQKNSLTLKSLSVSLSKNQETSVSWSILPTYQLTVIIPVHLEAVKGMTLTVSDQFSDDLLLDSLQEVLQARCTVFCLLLLCCLVLQLGLCTAAGGGHCLHLLLSTVHHPGLTASLKHQQVKTPFH